MTRPILIVTGGSRGIGAATARIAAERGFDVAVNYTRDAAAAETVAQDCRAAGARAIAVQGDMASHADIVRLFDETARQLGPVTHLVNNAGVTGLSSKLADAAPEDIARTVNVNVTGAILVAREAVRRMAKSRGGQGGAIVNISSVAAILGSANWYVWYAATKAAIDTFTLGLAQEVTGDGIRVNAVQPGIIDTEIHASSGMPDRLKQVNHMIPMGRPGEAAEMARVILFLLSDEASYVSGAVLRASGGR